jgi:hypothetical protein
MRRHIGVAVALASLLALLASCERTQKSFGVENEILVFADSTDWQVVQEPLEQIFQKKIYTPQPEYLFTIRYVPASELNNRRRFKNLLLIGTLESSGPAATMVKAMLSADALERVKQGEAVVFQKKEPWAKNQLLVVLVARTQEGLRDWIPENDELLYSMFHQRLWDEMLEEMFALKEQKDIEKSLLQKYGWMVRVQHDYFVFKEDPDFRFVSLRRPYPERWFFVHWVDTDDPSFLTPEWVLDKRDEIGRLYYENDRVNRDPSLVRVDTVDFLGREAIMIQGLWENEEKQAGGPFKTYAFYDPPTRRVYMIDLALFRPGEPKEPILRQLDVIAHTFKTIAEIKPEQVVD